MDVSDAAGNPAVQLSKTVARDVEAPTVTITSAEDITTANEGSYTIAGTCGETGTGNVKITIGSGTPQTIDCTTTGWTLSPTIADIPEGLDLALVVEHWDSYGNVAVVRDQTISKDTVVPTLGSTPSPITSLNQDSYNLDGSCAGGQGAVNLNIGGISASANCASDVWEVNNLDVNSLTGSSITITVDVSDAAGNPAVQLSKTVARDVEAPTLTITSLEDITTANVGSYTIAGTCGETGTGNVKITIASGTPQTIDCTATAWTLSPTIADIPAGLDVALVVEHWDSYGNVAVVSDQTISKETTAPQVTITTPLAEITESNLESYPLSGTCTFGDGRLTVAVGTATPDGTVDCQTEGTWSASVNVSSLEKGIFNVTASQTNILGNRGDDRESITKAIGGMMVSAGGTHTCALKPNGQVACWGDGSFGRLGHGTTTSSSTPVDVHTSSTNDSTLDGIVGISSGLTHTCALTTDGNVKCWGEGGHRGGWGPWDDDL